MYGRPGREVLRLEVVEILTEPVDLTLEHREAG
jgi:hypothetical protein